MDLPRRSETLTRRGASASTRPAATASSFRTSPSQLQAGQGLGVIGPSASGKSSLVRAMVGRLAADPGQDPARRRGARPVVARGARPAYRLPAAGHGAVRGTVAENIARFEPDARSEEVIAAAGRPSVHEMILALPDGYETQIGEGGKSLSAGQRQRIGARPRALWRSVPGRARRAQLQPRPRRRRGADRGHPRCPRARRHRRRGRHRPSRAGRRRPWCWSC